MLIVRDRALTIVMNLSNLNTSEAPCATNLGGKLRGLLFSTCQGL